MPFVSGFLSNIRTLRRVQNFAFLGEGCSLDPPSEMGPRSIIKHLHLCYLQCLLSSKLVPTDLQQEPITINGLLPVVHLVSFKIFEIHHSFYVPADRFDSWRVHLPACLSFESQRSLQLSMLLRRQLLDERFPPHPLVPLLSYFFFKPWVPSDSYWGFATREESAVDELQFILILYNSYSAIK